MNTFHDLNTVNAVLNSLGAFDGSNVTLLLPHSHQLSDAEKYEEAVKNQRLQREMTSLLGELSEIIGDDDAVSN